MEEEFILVPALPDDPKDLRELFEFMEDEITQLVLRVREVEKALKFYASPASWTHGSMSKSWAWQDNGNRARAAMAKARGK